MKWLANACVWLSLAAASFGSVSVYWPTLEGAAASPAPLTLTSPAGRDPEDPARALVEAGQELTAEVAAQLRAGQVKRVKVKEFAWSRWSGKYLFLLGSVGMVAGAVMMRRAGRSADADVHDSPAGAPRQDHPLQRAAELLDELVAAALHDGEPLPLPGVVAKIEEVQHGPLAEFVASLELLQAKLGSGGYAQFMDRFAAAERLLNRSWSAGVDGADEECRACLPRSRDALLEALALLP